jgi:hypothetical protein
MSVDNRTNRMKEKGWSTENTPYIFQHDYINLGRSYIHNGKFLHPNFGIYTYPKIANEIPLDWHQCFNDLKNDTERNIRNFYGYLAPEDLFQNLEKCKLEFSGSFHSIDVKKLHEIIDEEVKFDFKFTPICDGGYKSTNLYIYIKELKLYRRFTLKHSGEYTINHESERINSLLKQVGFDGIYT